MDQILALIPNDGAWSVVAILLILVFGSQQIFSEAGAKRFWIFGRIASRIETRKRRSIEREAELEKTRAEYLERMIRDLRADLDDEYRRSREMEKSIRQELRDAIGYIRYATEWSQTILHMAAKHDWRPAPPKYKFYDEWLRSQFNDED